MFPTAGSVNPHINAGRLRALAVTSLKPTALAPGLPTLSETLPGYESVSLNGVFAPVRAIQRVETVGGIAPTVGCDAAAQDQETRVSYEATYYFYGENA